MKLKNRIRTLPGAVFSKNKTAEFSADEGLFLHLDVPEEESR